MEWFGTTMLMVSMFAFGYGTALVINLMTIKQLRVGYAERGRTYDDLYRETSNNTDEIYIWKYPGGN